VARAAGLAAAARRARAAAVEFPPSFTTRSRGLPAAIFLFRAAGLPAAGLLEADRSRAGPSH